MQEIINKSKHISNLYGLVVCGGKSIRMGTDKSQLVYFNKPYRYELYEMLTSFCERVFISCNADQVSEINTAYSTIQDMPAFGNIGPMSALLSAFDQFPGKDLFVIGCDYPFITNVELKAFINAIKPAGLATAFYNPDSEFYEPLLAYYDHKANEELLRMHANNEFSLQYFLNSNNAGKFIPENLPCMRSVNSFAAYQEALKEIHTFK